MYRFTVNYREQERHTRGQLFNRGYFATGVPRLIPLCRLFGHRPVVDGADSGSNQARWVVCDRCGVRPEPQGSLDPAAFNVGDTYDALLVPLDLPASKEARFKALKGLPRFYAPGAWPERPTGALGAQVLVGRHGLFGAGVKVGNGGSEHTLAAHLYLSPLFGIAVHTERFGTGVQRRLNPTGYDSRVIEVSTTPGHLYWRLWVKRDEWSRATPKWRDGNIRVEPRDILLGEKRYSYEKAGDPVMATVRMPHGDDHEVSLQLERQRHGRKRGLRPRESWVVDWSASPGIPTKPGGHGGVSGSAVKVSDRDATDGTWPAAAAAAIAVDLTRDRVSYGFCSTADR